MKLKICKVRTSRSAFDLVQAGVDYLGFHVLDTTKVEQRLRFAAINRQLRAEGFEGGVVLTKADDLDWTVETAIDGWYRFVQVHRDAHLGAIVELATRLRSWGISLIQVVDPTIHDSAHAREILMHADYVLYDNYIGGTGRQIAVHDLARMPMDRAFVAGGINDVRAQELKANSSPYAIDVQSWVQRQSDSGDQSKDMERVAALVDIAHA